MTDEKKPKIPPPPLRPPMAKPPQASGPAKAAFPQVASRPQGVPVRPPAPAAKAPQVQTPAAKYSSAANSSASSEVDEIRKQMESQIMGLQNQLQEEKEKLLMQTVRAKEEEAMAAKVEESLKDIQDRVRREKREQELQESLSKSELQIKDLEQRIIAERQTWVETFKSQVNQREGQDKELEHGFELKLKELERRWHEEKLSWSQALRNKEEEIARFKREAELAITNEKSSYEKRISQIETERDSFRRELKDLSEVRDEERAMSNSKLESRDKEFLSLKAQQAMVVTQLRQGKEKEDQLRALLERMRAEKNSLITQLESKDKEYFLLKTQFALYQTRAKTEQEKTLSEMLLYKAQMQKDREQWEINSKTNENELRTLAESHRVREAELKQAIERKEFEAATLIRQNEEKLRTQEAMFKQAIEKHEAEHASMLKEAESKLSSAVRSAEDKFRSHEIEVSFILEKKDSEIRSIIKESQEKITAMEQSYSQQLAQKDKDARAQQLQLIENIQAKEREINALNEKQRDLSIQAAQYEQNINSLEEKLKYQSEASAKDIERYAQKEKELAAACTQKEIELKDASEDLAEANTCTQALNIELAKKEQQISQLKADLERETRSLIDLAKINEAKTNEAAMFVQKEREYKLLLEQHEQKIQGLAEQLRVKTEEYSRINEKAARAGNELKQAEENRAREMAEKTREINALLSKDSDNRVQTVRFEHKVRELEEKTALAELRLQEKSNAARDKETELFMLREKFDLLKKEATEKLAQEREIFNVQLSQAREETKNAYNLKEAEMRDLRTEKENLKAEIARISSEIISKEREAETFKGLISAKEKEADAEIERIQGLFASEKHVLTEKVRGLEELLTEAQKKPDVDLKRIEKEWNKKEDTFNAVISEKEASIKALKIEVESWKKEKEKLVELKSQTEDMNQAELMSVQRKLWENKEKFSEQLKEKEKELEAYKDAQKGIEEKVRTELFEKYKAKIEVMEKENQAISKDVSAEVSAIRASLQADLKKKEEQYTAERAVWEAKLNEKEAVVSSFINKIESLNDKLKEKDTTAIVGALKEIVKMQVSSKTSGASCVDSVSPTAKPKDIFDKTAKIELAKPPEVAAQAAAKKESFIASVWKNINEPVIEIGTGKKENEKKDK